MLIRVARYLGTLLLICYGFVSATLAGAEPPAQSNSYTFEESVIGVGGMNQSSSSSYLSEVGVGDIGIGNSASSNYQIDAGSKTSPDPTLSFVVNNAPDFNDFTTTQASTTTSSFTVSNYTSYGYAVTMIGNPPTNGGHSIAPIAPGSPPYTSVSIPGTEQFGINLVANTSPSVGLNPDHNDYPIAGQFGYGDPTANYSVNDEFRYVSGETIAIGPKSSGVTTYTISYLVNVEALTVGGKYTTNQTLIVTATY